MERFMKGDIVVILFPFSDFRTYKRRPALIAARPVGEDVVLAQITSNINNSKYSVKISSESMKNSILEVASIVKVNRLFSVDKAAIIRKIGTLNESKMNEVENSIISLFIA